MIKDLKYYLDLATKEKAHTCNCQYNSNSRDNEHCCRFDGRQTNADRIRNMSDEELAKWFDTVTKDVLGGSTWDKNGWLKWLQEESEGEDAR